MTLRDDWKTNKKFQQRRKLFQDIIRLFYQPIIIQFLDVTSIVRSMRLCKSDLQQLSNEHIQWKICCLKEIARPGLNWCDMHYMYYSSDAWMHYREDYDAEYAYYIAQKKQVCSKQDEDMDYENQFKTLRSKHVYLQRHKFNKRK